jgi:hypothetical protein
MQTINWGQVTPESANLNTNTFVYVYNHDLTSIEKVNRTIRFIIGRLSYYDKHLPKEPIHKLKIDIRGQQIVSETCDFIQQELKLKYSRPDSLEIEFVK